MSNFYGGSFGSFSKNLSKMSDFNEIMTRDTRLRQYMIKSYGLRNQSILDKLYSIHSLTSWNKQLSFKQHLKVLDSMESLRNYSSNIPSALKYSNLLSSLATEINLDILSDIIEDEEITNSEPGEVNNQDDVDCQLEIKRPAFFNIAFNINVIISTTDSEFEQGTFEEKERNIWENLVKPVLKWVNTLMLAWAFSDAPVADLNIYKSIEGIINHIEQTDINLKDLNVDDEDEIQIEILDENSNRV
ncbi:MAG: hypothetical protein ACQEWF_01785 [Bacillota bacterium]